MIVRLASLIVRLAALLLPRPLRDWGLAMRAEVAAIARPADALGFALGSLRCAAGEALSHYFVQPLLRPPTPTAETARTETLLMPLPTSLLVRPRLLGSLCALGATGLGLLYMGTAGAPARYLVTNAAALATGLLVLAALASAPRPGALARNLAAPAIGLALLLTALGGISADGVSRWISLGGLPIQPSLLLVPVLVVGFARAPDGWALAGILIAAPALALQPDRAMAGALAAGLVALALARPRRPVLVAAAAAVAAFAAAMLRPDASPAMPYVDGILFSAFDVHPLAGLAVLAGAALMILPAVASGLAEPADRVPYAVFGAVWLAVLAAAALGNYPTPLVGYGGSAILGYALSLIALPPRAGAEAAAPAEPAPAADGVDRPRLLRAGL